MHPDLFGRTRLRKLVLYYGFGFEVGKKLSKNKKSKSYFHNQTKSTHKKYNTCYGYFQRQICVFGSGDFNYLMNNASHNMFANKVDCNDPDSQKLLNMIENRLYSK